MGDMPPKPEVIGSYPTCKTCGASAILRDAWAIWNQMTASWEVQALFDDVQCDTCGVGIAIEWKVDKDFRTRRIQRLNDAMRRGDVHQGTIVLTPGIQALGKADVVEVMAKVEAYSAFTEDNDPYGEHDYGAFDHNSARIFWKIDYFDLELKWHSPDAANPNVTRRVLTVMLAHEY